MAFEKSGLFERYPKLEACREALGHALDTLSTAYRSGGKLMVMGNGGSSADAEHLCGEARHSLSSSLNYLTKYIPECKIDNNLDSLQ